MDFVLNAAAALTEWGIHGERAVRRVTGGEQRAQRRRREEAAKRPEGVVGTDTTNGPVVTWHEGGAGDPVVLINGYGASGLLWPSGWLADLEERHRVIRIDNRMTGWSRRAPIPFTVADMADDVAAVLRQLGLSGGRVLGMSLGGAIAQELAMRHPQLVEHLVLVSTIPPSPASALASSRHVLHTDVDLMASMLIHGGMASREARQGRAGRQLLRFAGPELVGDPEVEAELGAQMLRRPTPPRLLLEQSRAIAAWRGPNRLRGISAPSTVVHGSADPLVLPRNAHTLADLIPGARLVELPGVGHLVPWEAPGELARILEEPT
ncbi:MAG: alpha/beta hydrolase [Tetrasphaera sp.]